MTRKAGEARRSRGSRKPHGGRIVVSKTAVSITIKLPDPVGRCHGNGYAGMRTPLRE